MTSKIDELDIVYQNLLILIQEYVNTEYYLNPPRIKKLLIAPLKIFFGKHILSLSFNLKKISINPSTLELDSELRNLLRSKYIGENKSKKINRPSIDDWKLADFQTDQSIVKLEYKLKGLIIKELIYLISHDFNTKDSIKDLIDTKYRESTETIRKKLVSIENIDEFYINNIKSFCLIINEIVLLMHLNDENAVYLQKSAEKYWNEHKNEIKTNMETDWFQPELYKFFITKFNSENVLKEPESTRGKVDFLVYNVPIDAKCYNDKKNKNDIEKSGINLIESEINQIYQYSTHTNLGIMIAYDFRDRASSTDIKNQSITERIEFMTKGQKLIGNFVILRRKTPTEIKNV